MAERRRGHGRHRRRLGRLLVDVRALSGRTYPAGTLVSIAGGGSAVDGFVAGDWLSLSWWEYTEAGEPPGRGER